MGDNKRTILVILFAIITIPAYFAITYLLQQFGIDIVVYLIIIIGILIGIPFVIVGYLLSKQKKE